MEPIFTDYYTPEAGQVFRGLEKEAARINYFDMTAQGLRAWCAAATAGATSRS